MEGKGDSPFVQKVKRNLNVSSVSQILRSGPGRVAQVTEELVYGALKKERPSEDETLRRRVEREITRFGLDYISFTCDVGGLLTTCYGCRLPDSGEVKLERGASGVGAALNEDVRNAIDRIWIKDRYLALPCPTTRDGTFNNGFARIRNGVVEDELTSFDSWKGGVLVGDGRLEILEPDVIKSGHFSVKEGYLIGTGLTIQTDRSYLYEHDLVYFAPPLFLNSSRYYDSYNNRLSYLVQMGGASYYLMAHLPYFNEMEDYQRIISRIQKKLLPEGFPGEYLEEHPSTYGQIHVSVSTILQSAHKLAVESGLPSLAKIRIASLEENNTGEIKVIKGKSLDPVFAISR